MLSTIILIVIAIVVVGGAGLWLYGERWRPLRLSTWKMMREGGLRGLLDFSGPHGYVYGRWIKESINILTFDGRSGSSGGRCSSSTTAWTFRAKTSPRGAHRSPPISVPGGNTLRIACVANLHRYNGHLDLVEAAHRVAEIFPEARFLLAGSDAAAGEAVRRRIGELGLETSVRLLGPRADVASILAASDLVVHPSIEEGFSNAILEAMAAGKPVVATRVGGNPEAVEDGITGRLVPPGDPETLASTIIELLRDTARAEAMGRAGRERLRQRFSLAGMVAGVEESYIELLEGRPLSRRV